MIKQSFIEATRLYQRWFSPDKGVLAFLYPSAMGCRMYPTCSEYMIGAIQKYGAIKGLFLGVRRILRCHPYQKELIDHP